MKRKYNNLKLSSLKKYIKSDLLKHIINEI